MSINIKNPPKNVQIIKNPTGVVVQNNTAVASNWIKTDLREPQLDFEVLVSCDDDVSVSIYRGDGWFENRDGTHFQFEYWMDKPEPAEGR